ncbi:MAG: hypothetical protein ACXW1W_00920 [Methylococcaceae bacterium]
MKSYYYWLDIVITTCLLYAPIAVLNPQWLNLNHLPTGGDTASHVFYAIQFCNYFPQEGLTQWLPEVFGGLPFLSYYFPLPFIVVYLLKVWMPFALAFKWAVFGACIVTPVSIYGLSVFWIGFSRMAGLFAGISVLAFLCHEQNSIWGGNLLSVLAGEFGYSYGLLFSVLTLAVWIKALQGRYYWMMAGIFEAASGFSHGYALLMTGFVSLFLLCCGNFKASLRFLILSHALAFFLLAGWLWPLLEMHALTIPNDGSYLSSNWRDYLPKTLWPILLIALLGGVMFCFPGIRRQWHGPQRQAVAFVLAAIVLAGSFWFSANRIGLADIRFFPYVWLFSAILAGWLFGESLSILLSRMAYQRFFLLYSGIAAVVVVLISTWIYRGVDLAPKWSEWNHSGYEDKASWRRLATLFPVLTGGLDSPRLLFEHAPVNNDVGSTRALEALPMFLGQRPVLEGLYMESALLGPAIYHLQSEVSQAPSSPLVRFPSASLDVSAAASHMNLLHTNEVLVRSNESNAALEKSALFEKVAVAAPFSVYRLKYFDSQFIQLSPLPMRAINDANWMENAFNWFKKYPNVDYWPVYVKADAALVFSNADTVKTANIQLLAFERQRIVFSTDRPGLPHLLKMSFHPRWQLKGKGRIYLAAPGYMMVVPETNQVELVYGTTPLGRFGEVASVLAFCIFIIQLLRKRNRLDGKKSPGISVGKGVLIWSAVFFSINVESYQSNPERYYSRAWQSMHRQAYQAAASDFDHIEGRRRSSASQEEALFWAAKAHELAGNRLAAKQRYQKIADSYTGYWLPESLYTLAKLHRLDNQLEAALPLEQRLRSQYPQHAFTRALEYL